MASSFSISVWDSKFLQAAILAIRAANKEVQADIRRFTKAEVSPDWQKEVASHLDRRAQLRVLADTARVKVSNQNVLLQSAMIGRPLSKSAGSSPSNLARPEEFGVVDRDRVKTYMRRTRKGKLQSVTRHTTRQLPPVKRKGYAVYPAAANMIPRFASLWVQTAMRTILDAIDKK